MTDYDSLLSSRKLQLVPASEWLTSKYKMLESPRLLLVWFGFLGCVILYPVNVESKMQSLSV